jgi:hypothetical protein
MIPTPAKPDFSGFGDERVEQLHNVLGIRAVRRN